jgi:hypothetical protein
VKRKASNGPFDSLVQRLLFFHSFKRLFLYLLIRVLLQLVLVFDLLNLKGKLFVRWITLLKFELRLRQRDHHSFGIRCLFLNVHIGD